MLLDEGLDGAGLEPVGAERAVPVEAETELFGPVGGAQGVDRRQQLRRGLAFRNRVVLAFDPVAGQQLGLQVLGDDVGHLHDLVDVLVVIVQVLAEHDELGQERVPHPLDRLAGLVPGEMGGRHHHRAGHVVEQGPDEARVLVSRPVAASHPLGGQVVALREDLELVEVAVRDELRVDVALGEPVAERGQRFLVLREGEVLLDHAVAHSLAAVDDAVRVEHLVERLPRRGLAGRAHRELVRVRGLVGGEHLVGLGDGGGNLVSQLVQDVLAPHLAGRNPAGVPDARGAPHAAVACVLVPGPGLLFVQPELAHEAAQPLGRLRHVLFHLRQLELRRRLAQEVLVDVEHVEEVGQIVGGQVELDDLHVVVHGAVDLELDVEADLLAHQILEHRRDRRVRTGHTAGAEPLDHRRALG